MFARISMNISRYCLCIFFALLGCMTSAQGLISGHVYHAVTGERIVDANVTSGSERETVSDFSGNFHFIIDSTSVDDFQFNGNIIYWNNPIPFKISIHTLGGKSVFSESLTSATSTQLPNLPAGVYILGMRSSRRQSSYKIVAGPDYTFNADKRALRTIRENPPYDSFDTLLVQKKGFFERRLPVADLQINHRIGLVPEDITSLEYLNEIQDPAIFAALGSTPSRSNRGNVQEVKFVYDLQHQVVYYMNSKKWEFHVEFATHVLGYDKGYFQFNATQYTNNKERIYILGSLSYYEGIDKYVIHYGSVSELTCRQTKTVYQALQSSFIGKTEIALFPLLSAWNDCQGVPLISSEMLYQGQLYQGLSEGSTYGYLRRVPSTAIERTIFNRRDLIVTDGIPNDLPVVAGIITSIPQTPLSHINVLSHSRNTPNMYLKGAYDLDSIVDLDNQLVHLQVHATGFELRLASIQEATLFWDQVTPQEEIILPIDSISRELLTITEVSLDHLPTIGGKAANFAELSEIEGVSIPTPENAFAIPMYHYLNHIRTHGIDSLIHSTLSDPQFQTDIIHRKAQLILIQERIKSAPIAPELVLQVQSRLHHFEDFDAYRFRSSTNAEDLEYFSGAGLYDSFSAKKGHETKTVENAIKKVWASLWNWRAYEERAYFKIDHMSCAMAVLVHRSFPDEDANGVLVTKNLYNQNPGFIINVQYGEESIVFPREGIIHDQIILFTWSINAGEEFMIEYLSYSNLPQLNGNTVMSDDELLELGTYAKAIKRHFYLNTPHNCDCTYDEFGVDLEFKIDSEVSPRKIYIKQARLYQ